jgi:NAD(P)-dependent dehydrogenase (short-subunit alcohol dehydrogenase family)
MLKLEGKTALITGGNSGIGLAGAQLFAAEGAKVAISGRNADTLQEAAKQIGHGAIGIVAEVSKLPEIDNLYRTVAEKFGKIDVLVVAAGIFKGAPLADYTEELYDEIADINLKGAFFSVQIALPFLNDGASIVLLSSAATQTGMANASAYLATKVAVLSLARDFSVELLDRNIRVNVLTPGPIATPIFGRLGLSQEAEDGVTHSLAQTSLLKRMGTTEEMARGLLFLASDDSSYMLGSELVLDGGMSFKQI